MRQHKKAALQGGPAGGPKKGRGAAAPGKTAKRLLGLVTKRHRLRLVLVVIFILLSAVAGVAGSLFLQVLIDDYITPLIGSESPAFGGLARAILGMAAVYGCGVMATLLYNRMMVSIAQGCSRRYATTCFPICRRCPSATLTPIPTAS